MRIVTTTPTRLPNLQYELDAPNGMLDFAISVAWRNVGKPELPISPKNARMIWAEFLRQSIVTVNGCPVALLDENTLSTVKGDFYANLGLGEPQEEGNQ